MKSLPPPPWRLRDTVLQNSAGKMSVLAFHNKWGACQNFGLGKNLDDITKTVMTKHIVDRVVAQFRFQSNFDIIRSQNGGTQSKSTCQAI